MSKLRATTLLDDMLDVLFRTSSPVPTRHNLSPEMVASIHEDQDLAVRVDQALQRGGRAAALRLLRRTPPYSYAFRGAAEERREARAAKLRRQRERRT